MSCVSIVRCESYEPSLVEKAVREACISAGMPDVQDKTILLKPNILSDSKEELGITTHSQANLFIRIHLLIGGHIGGHAHLLHQFLLFRCEII